MHRLAKVQKMKSEKEMVDLYRKSVVSLYPSPCCTQVVTMKFTVPARWIEARLAFTRSAALWGMVRTFVGLGDRHAENILIHSPQGDGTC